MRVLIACEYSGTERKAFALAGHQVLSCDLLPGEQPDYGIHYQGDVRDVLGERWDLVIAHPPCTFLSNSGVRWLYSKPGRWSQMQEGAAFFRLMFDFRTPRLCVENPVQHKHAMAAHGMGPASQTIQPYQFGHLETKRTCLWLRGLPLLQPTEDVYDRFRALPKSEGHRVHYASPGADRWKVRSESYPGIARAMAEQWTSEGERWRV